MHICAWHPRCAVADLCAICISTGVLCLVVLLSLVAAELILQAPFLLWAFVVLALEIPDLC